MSKEMRDSIDTFKNKMLIKEDKKMMRDINHNLEVAKPNFLYFIKNMNAELSKWIQYQGVETEGSQIFFKFKSSQNSLNFKVYAGVNVNDIEFLLSAKSKEIYEYFRQLKYDNI